MHMRCRLEKELLPETRNCKPEILYVLRSRSRSGYRSTLYSIVRSELCAFGANV